MRITLITGRIGIYSFRLLLYHEFSRAFRSFVIKKPNNAMMILKKTRMDNQENGSNLLILGFYNFPWVTLPNPEYLSEELDLGINACS